ncbi:MAG: Thiolase, N-terminal domain-containing protein [Piptocephalis tieghemiana]|nr:MAG: Thiolase, N-terminal domain-containing protein [Piptocephalis tieghemiana]
MSAQRVQQIASHLLPAAPSTAGKLGVKGDDDVVIVSALRTPITRAKRGGFKDTLPDVLLTAVLRATLERTGISPKEINDVAVGNVLAPGAGATQARMAALAAGLTIETAVVAVNRQCSSGLQACAQIAAAIRAGYIDVGIGAGVESMTAHYGAGAMGEASEEIINTSPSVAACQLPMGITSENVAKAYGITRQAQDTLAADSHRKAFEARKAGRFQEEIVPVTLRAEDGSTQVIREDDGIRQGVTAQSLSKLKTVFDEKGSTTAGNASQVSDGAAAVLLMRRSKARALGLTPLGKFVDSIAVGVPPEVMGIGPAIAIPKVCQRVGLSPTDVDVVELNEAFASQAVYCIDHLGLDPARVNPNGGAIALGHPLGCTGARQIATLLPELKRRGAKVGLTSMCIGTGMGMAAIIERE